MNLSPIKRRSVLQGMAALGSTGLLGTALAQTGKAAWPTKPIRLVVPFNAGGATDIIARTVGEALSKRIGQPVVVDNKGGAAGILGTDAVAKAPADGHTLLLTLSTSMLINQFLYTKLPYNPQKDLALITQVAAAPVTLVVHPSVPANNMKELLAYVKAQKGKLSYGSWGTGSYAHLAGAYMSKTTDSDMVHVAYKGEAPMIQELIGGQLQLCFSSALNTKPFIDSGRVKAIGVTGKQRMDILPKVPTIFEQGVQDDAYSIFGWVAMGAPAGIPKEIVDQLSAHLREVAKDPKVVERIAAAGFLPMMNSPQEFQQNYQRDMPIWKALVEAAGARLD
ncbi:MULTISPECIES: tripartite tricarboxylate transporter substrate binding protein [unclassified Acidovorax]|jgi:tripartite-type tricarboxylate transporter receptor subunit TctC|uniref:Bug family tripartite tricarboxylate transporter substrate binding protein n=1 Tax=unclassified Acidovorax TaxID=2684926 RepID=UPI000BD19F98|nr:MULTISPECIES: tripartite tricarboxylate transporter substrate binding protein [unclassified Acidovorax]MCL5740533.1 tripartite tricarboxylate transporter substrate binding protein [Betaproteobacteria bacterium]HQS20883.1 tripartite tricarboxylate transporter substrate binding protein [Acidovorax defluvii]MBP8225330.1 tripartite tricarboxylate transporter substrate binding protein [Acidovorax sp.]OYY28094.1 MAG: ABC transporter substrate-binding protein [Acidovorax sp. 35-64-16]OYY86337.1 MA